MPLHFFVASRSKYTFMCEAYLILWKRFALKMCVYLTWSQSNHLHFHRELSLQLCRALAATVFASISSASRLNEIIMLSHQALHRFAWKSVRFFFSSLPKHNICIFLSCRDDTNITRCQQMQTLEMEEWREPEWRRRMREQQTNSIFSCWFTRPKRQTQSGDLLNVY